MGTVLVIAAIAVIAAVPLVLTVLRHARLAAEHAAFYRAGWAAAQEERD